MEKVESKETCDNLQVMCQGLENYGTQAKQVIVEIRHRIGNCFCECNKIRPECKKSLSYFMDKAGIGKEKFITN